MQENAARPVPGSCFCGAVRFQVTLPSLFCAHCHCSMCRRSHGAAFVTWFAVPKSRFKIVDGGDRLVRHASSSHGTRTFCGTCGSSLFCESTQHPEKIDIVLANMDGRIDREPQLHVYYSDRARWVTLDDELPRLGGETGLEPLAGDPTADYEV